MDGKWLDRRVETAVDAMVCAPSRLPVVGGLRVPERGVVPGSRSSRPTRWRSAARALEGNRGGVRREVRGRSARWASPHAPSVAMRVTIPALAAHTTPTREPATAVWNRKLVAVGCSSMSPQVEPRSSRDPGPQCSVVVRGPGDGDRGPAHGHERQGGTTDVRVAGRRAEASPRLTHVRPRSRDVATTSTHLAGTGERDVHVRP